MFQKPSNINDQLFKDLENANEDVLSRAFKKSSRNRPLYCCNMIPKFKYWWKNFGLIDMGFNNYKVHYPYIPKQPANNFSDSGIYVMMFLEHWKPPWDSLFTLFKASDIPNLRMKLANDLLLSPKNTGRKELVTSYMFEGTSLLLLLSLMRLDQL